LLQSFIDFDRHNYHIYAAALAFYFFLSVFPLFIFFSTVLTFIPVPHLFEQSLELLARVVPREAMAVVRSVLAEVLRTGPSLLSFSIIGVMFGASGGFASLITILNIAYDVQEGRPYWKTRLVAFWLTCLTGTILVSLLMLVAAGPALGSHLSSWFPLAGFFGDLWPYVRKIAILLFTVLSVESIYFLAPNVKQRFKDQVVGAVIAVSTWITASWGLGWYLSNFANYNRTFGTLGAVVGLMLWFYITALAVILGAYISSECTHVMGGPRANKQLVIH